MNKRDIRDIEGILGQSEHAYNFAALESRWSKHMTESGIVGKEERKQFVRQAYIDENELHTKKDEAR